MDVILKLLHLLYRWHYRGNEREKAIADLLKMNRHKSAESIQNAILTKVEKFRGSAEQHDDVTMVIVKSKN